MKILNIDRISCNGRCQVAFDICTKSVQKRIAEEKKKKWLRRER